MNQRKPQTVEAAGIFLLVTEQKPWEFVLLRHPNRWDLPKGHCDAGEIPRETALRELREETGIHAGSVTIDETFKFELSYSVQYSNRGEEIFLKHVRYFLGFLSNKPKLTLTEHSGFEWFPWSPPHQIQCETIDPLIAAIAKHLQ